MSHLLSFNFQTSQVRVVEVDNEPWFVSMDIAEVLDYVKVDKMINLVDEDDKQTINPKSEDYSNLAESFGSNTFKVSIINESGLYAVIFGSTKPEAKNFKKWVTSEVLPSIRKNGFYINKDVVQNTDQLTQLMMNMQQQLIQMESRFVNFESEKEQWNIQKSKLESEKEQHETRISKYEAEIVELENESKLMAKQREAYLEDQLQLQKVYNQLPGLKAAIESAKAMPDENLATFTLKEFLQENFPDLNIERGQRINIGRTVSNFCKLAKIKELPKLYNQKTLYDKRFEPMMAIATLLELGMLKKFVQ